MLRKLIGIVGISVLALCFAFLPWSEFLYKTGNKKTLADSLSKRLLQLGGKSLLTRDVPVGAILVYKGVVIGTGYNTVFKDSVAYGHAEINALTMAIKKYGVKDFLKLDRNNLELLTTLEPCEMCKGAIVEYRIKLVKFMKSKDFRYWFEENRWRLLYEIKKTQVHGGDRQDSLLNLHPEYGK